MTLLTNARVLHDTNDNGFIIIQNHICILMLMTISIYLYINYTLCILTLVFLSLKLYVYCLILQKESCIHGVSRVCCERMWFLVFLQKVTFPGTKLGEGEREERNTCDGVDER